MLTRHGREDRTLLVRRLYFYKYTEKISVTIRKISVNAQCGRLIFYRHLMRIDENR